MTEKQSVTQQAETDLQLKRFLQRAEEKRKTRMAQKSQDHSYGKNHIPATRDLGSEAATALNTCTTK